MDNQSIRKINKFFAGYPLLNFEKGRIIVHPDIAPLGVYQLINGQISEYDITDQGDEVIVNFLKPPVFFPISWTINKADNQFFYKAYTPVKLRMAPADDVAKFLETDLDVSYNLMKLLYSNVNGLRRRLAHIMGGNSRSRVLYELIAGCREFGELQKNGSYVLNIHEDNLAQLAGLSRETVNRQLIKLKKLGLVNMDHKRITVHKLSDLESELGTSL